MTSRGHVMRFDFKARGDRRALGAKNARQTDMSYPYIEAGIDMAGDDENVRNDNILLMIGDIRKDACDGSRNDSSDGISVFSLETGFEEVIRYKMEKEYELSLNVFTYDLLASGVGVATNVLEKKSETAANEQAEALYLQERAIQRLSRRLKCGTKNGKRSVHFYDETFAQNLNYALERVQQLERELAVAQGSAKPAATEELDLAMLFALFQLPKPKFSRNFMSRPTTLQSGHAALYMLFADR